jgi:ATP-dependent exoDNAse (exonuclease V) alpha subunit
MSKKTKKNTLVNSTVYEKNPLINTLNPQQIKAKEEMGNFLKTREKFFLLSGGAGTGKTHTIGALIAHLQGNNQALRIACSAPTNKAVKVIKNSTKQWQTKNIDYGTIYQFLGLTMDYDEEGGKVLVEGRTSTIDKYDVIIIDESSMVSSKLWKLLKRIVLNHNLKIIFVGDNAQLNPVNEDESPIFSQVTLKAELTQVMRQNEYNPVMDLIQSARAKVFDFEQELLLQNSYNLDKTNGVWILDRQSWLKQIIRAFQSPNYQDNPDYVRVIAWTNRTVNNLNNHIRNSLYHNPKERFVIGERLIAMETIFDYVRENEIIINNSEEFTVLKIRKSVSEDGYHIWELRVLDSAEDTHWLQVIDQVSINNFQAHLRDLAQEARSKQRTKCKNPWADFWQHKNRYANVNYAYSLTSHRSQGSTFNNVFVAQNDIFCNPNLIERYRSLYVSYSRTSERLFVN